MVVAGVCSWANSSCGWYKLLTDGVGRELIAGMRHCAVTDKFFVGGRKLLATSFGIYLAGWHEAVGIVAMVTASFSRAGRGI